MGGINFGRFNRIMLRCVEAGTEAGMKASVTRMYEETLRPALEVYLAAHSAVAKAETALRKEHKEATDALITIDAPYREARSVVRAFAPETVLPDTLKAQPTDTDQLNAIKTLVGTLDEHSGQAWADEITQGEFGQHAAATVKELNEAIAADKQLASAREARAAAYGPAYERYLRFKGVVRNALGAKSRQYKRIHLRAASSASDDAPETKPDPVMVVRPPVEPAPASSRQAPASSRQAPPPSRLGEAQPS